MKYYHITPVENAESILINGIIANEEGQIFLFENKSVRSVLNKNKKITVADSIAINQICITKYAMFEIDEEAFEVELKNDNVAELTSRMQWILEQPRIYPEYIELFGIYEYEGFTDIED